MKHIIGNDFDVYLNKPAEAADIPNAEEIEKNMLEMTGNNQYTVNMFLDRHIYDRHDHMCGIFKVCDHKQRIWEVVMKVFKLEDKPNLIYGLKLLGGDEIV